MSKKKTQRQTIEERMEMYGFVENVWAFQNYILRLGAIIHDMRQDGWDIETRYENKEGFKNCMYKLISKPTTFEHIQGTKEGQSSLF